MQKGRLAAIIDFNMRDIWNIWCQIARPFLQNKMCGFRERYAPKYFNSVRIKITDLRPLLSFHEHFSSKPLGLRKLSLYSEIPNDDLMHREGLTLTARGSTLGCRRQILTTKVDPRTVRVNIFQTHNIGIQMNQKS